MSIPVAKVEFVDESSNVYNLTPCYQYQIRLRRETPLSRFSFSIARATLWNARTSSYLNLLSPDLRKRVKIYSGTYDSGSTSYTQIYTGLPTKISETYLFGQTEAIRVEGFSLAYLLQRLDGSYSSTTYTGYSKGLIEYWCDEAGISYDLGYTDGLYLDVKTINYSNALVGLLDILAVLGPNVEAYFTAAGVLTIVDSNFWSEGSNELDLDQDDIISLSRYQELNKLITKAVIIGDTTESSYSADAESSLQTIYGVNKKTIASGLISSESQAQSLAASILWHGARYTDMAEIKLKFNINVDIPTVMTIADSDQSGTVRGGFRPEEITHDFSYGKRYETRATGFFDEGSSSSSSSSSSSYSSSSSSSSSLSSSSSSSLSSSSSSKSSSSSSSLSSSSSSRSSSSSSKSSSSSSSSNSIASSSSSSSKSSSSTSLSSSSSSSKSSSSSSSSVSSSSQSSSSSSACSISSSSSSSLSLSSSSQSSSSSSSNSVSSSSSSFSSSSSSMNSTQSACEYDDDFTGGSSSSSSSQSNGGGE